jgi:hypothetical protein
VIWQRWARKFQRVPECGAPDDGGMSAGCARYGERYSASLPLGQYSGARQPRQYATAREYGMHVDRANNDDSLALVNIDVNGNVSLYCYAYCDEFVISRVMVWSWRRYGVFLAAS